MNREKDHVPGAERPEGQDRRERFVLRGGAEGIAESVPEEPETTIDIEQVLRHLGDPERRTRVRRHPQF